MNARSPHVCTKKWPYEDTEKRHSVQAEKTLLENGPAGTLSFDLFTNNEEINFYCLSCPVGGTFLW